MNRRTFLAGNVVGAVEVATAGIAINYRNERMKSATIRFSQIYYFSTAENDHPLSPAEQFDNWRHSEKRDILAISLGQRPMRDEYTLVIGEIHYIDVLYQIPKSGCHGGPVQKEPL